MKTVALQSQHRFQLDPGFLQTRRPDKTALIQHTTVTVTTALLLSFSNVSGAYLPLSPSPSLLNILLSFPFDNLARQLLSLLSSQLYRREIWDSLRLNHNSVSYIEQNTFRVGLTEPRLSIRLKATYMRTLVFIIGRAGMKHFKNPNPREAAQITPSFWLP